ncbi:phosphotransferase enzyme family [Pyrenophora seminiperda CCB06]|uniref:Phosphotransferase enzyme family n=1 Tax=Pyrenophora seminiperda CCB06 TaxID=1302712 RepID=A0A3M7MD63_9PLEO|nr:phosphotransferase enzyme family [Pyrenophora seminiperda CCB06]
MIKTLGLGWLIYLSQEELIARQMAYHRPQKLALKLQVRTRFPSGPTESRSKTHALKLLYLDWNTRSEFFKFTRGRFVVDEDANLKKREVVFDMNALVKVAADAVGAEQCVDVRKFSDGMFNKACLMRMDDGREVVAKVPNPNAGRAFYTTASEVATMDFARRVLDTPAPRVYAYNSQAQSHAVGAEYIIMEKAQGVPLSLVWDKLALPQKLHVLLALVQIQKRWLSISFSHYGGLYYAKDIPSSCEASHYVQDGVVVKDSEFVVGPATGRDWYDAGRAGLDIERGPWSELSQYLRSIGERETKAIQMLGDPPKQIALFCGPKLYQPDQKEKLTALAQYRRILNTILPGKKTIRDPYLWHNDLHDDNIFVDATNPGKITSIIDWQSCHISPLFNHNADPAFLDWEGDEPENLDLVPTPDLSGLSPAEKSAAVRNHAHVNIFLAWRKLLRSKNPALFDVTEYRKTGEWGLIFLAHRMYEYGEAHFQSLLVDLKDTWPTGGGQGLFPVVFKEEEVERIKARSDGAVAATDLVTQVKEAMGELWPDKGLIEHERYDACRAALQEMKEKMIEELAENEEERAEYERYWPFD